MSFSLIPFLTYVFAVAGLLVCVSIVLKTMGRDNAFVRQFCPAESESDCAEVLKHGTLWKEVTLGDVGLMYFGAQLLFLLFAAGTGNVTAFFPALYVPAGLDFLLTFGLLAYQGFIIKQWCRLCLFVTAIIWVQAGLMGGHLQHLAAVSTTSVITLLNCLLLSGTWLLIKPLVAKAEENKKIRDRFLKLKRIPSIFVTVLKQQRSVAFNEPAQARIVLGNRDAPLQLLAVINPYCRACASEYPKIHQLLTKSADSIGVTIVFYVPGRFTAHKKTLAAQALTDAYFSDGDPVRQRRLFRDWFKIRKLRVWKSRWEPIVAHTDTGLLVRHETWCASNGIKFTPALFLNGYEVPDPYKIQDVSRMIEDIRTALSETPTTSTAD